MKRLERLPATIISTPLELDDYVAAYEAARAGNDKADPAAFLPPPEHPLHGDVLRELIRVDLEYAWRSGQGKRLEEYVAAFPHLFQDASEFAGLAEKGLSALKQGDIDRLRQVVAGLNSIRIGSPSEDDMATSSNIVRG